MTVSNQDPLVGTGGWAYFHVPGQDSLRAYASVFDFVEVNSTYYEYPGPSQVSRWHSRVPEGFEFSVRCHRDIVRALESESDSLLNAVIARMDEICVKLDANVLALLVPSRSRIGDAKLARKLDHVASVFKNKDTQIAVEIRGSTGTKVLGAMTRNDFIHCVDISTEMPAYESEFLYSRIFGKGKENVYQFDDEEIKEIADKASKLKFEKSILAFHGVRMYGDASRLKAFLQTGKFLQVTEQTGLDSLGAILKEDTEFPASKKELVDRQGWKLFDLAINRRMRAGKILSRLPNKIYKSHKELMSSLEPFISE